MGLIKSKLNYITITLKAYDNKAIIGFINNEVKCTTIYGNTVQNVIDDFNKFRKPSNKISCHYPIDNQIIITKEIEIFVKI